MKDVISQAIDDYGIEDGDVPAFYRYVYYCNDVDEGFKSLSWGALVNGFSDRYVASHGTYGDFAKAYYQDSGELIGVPKFIVSNVLWLGVWYDELEEHFMVLSDTDTLHFFRKDV